jgi:hypothetical protein
MTPSAQVTGISAWRSRAAEPPAASSRAVIARTSAPIWLETAVSTGRRVAPRASSGQARLRARGGVGDDVVQHSREPAASPDAAQYQTTCMLPRRTTEPVVSRSDSAIRRRDPPPSRHAL